MYKSSGKLILGLETGIDGGSVSILEDGQQIDFAAGSGAVSKSEDLLSVLDGLLEKNARRKREIGVIAVSDEPGSLTGLRIGLAIAKGLGDALPAKVRKISILDAMTSSTEREGFLISALKTDKNVIYCRKYLFRDGELQKRGEIIKNIGADEFKAKLKNLGNERFSIVCNEGVREAASDFFETLEFQKKSRIFLLKKNLAEILGQAASEKRVR
jgi:tRNA threonylcarbamoyl adenosine modification protein YeaZ